MDNLSLTSLLYQIKPNRQIGTTKLLTKWGKLYFRHSMKLLAHHYSDYCSECPRLSDWERKVLKQHGSYIKNHTLPKRVGNTCGSKIQNYTRKDRNTSEPMSYITKIMAWHHYFFQFKPMLKTGIFHNKCIKLNSLQHLIFIKTMATCGPLWCLIYDCGPDSKIYEGSKVLLYQHIVCYCITIYKSFDKSWQPYSPGKAESGISRFSQHA